MQCRALLLLPLQAWLWQGNQPLSWEGGGQGGRQGALTSLPYLSVVAWQSEGQAWPRTRVHLPHLAS